ncbi:hypothetical protein AYO43_03135 [Nitrospira sp. SCGC AG-212-E16]|nr:hypothetical protein AYO43_03135 [Nitrospira sp. SCGC AG-212-E16]
MLDASEIKRRVPIETIVTFYGGTLSATGEGRCLFPHNHAHGNVDSCMKVRDGRVMCCSQQCFGNNGADVFELVGLMDNLTAFPEQQRRVCQIGKLAPMAEEGLDGIVTVSMDKVPVAPPQWAWANRIPLQALTLIAGDPGLGKSTLTLELAARWSRGEADGDLRGNPVDVFIASAEDSAETTLKPRLIVAKADLSRVHIVQMRVKGLMGGITLPNDVAAVADRMRSLGAKIFIIDPLSAHLSMRVNSWKDQDLRQALAPLARVAEELRAAIVSVLHLNKDEKKNVLGRIGGTMAAVAAARSVLLAAPDSDDPDGSSKCLGHIKSNLGRPALTLRYRLEEEMVVYNRKMIFPASKLVWEGEDRDLQPHDLLTRTERVDRSKRKEAGRWLREILADGPKATEDIYLEGRKVGLSESTLDRAKADLGIRSKKHSFGGKGAWCWQLLVEEGQGTREEALSQDSDTLHQTHEKKRSCVADLAEECQESEIDTLREKGEPLCPQGQPSVPYPVGSVIRFKTGLGFEDIDTIKRCTTWAKFPGQTCYQVKGGYTIPHSWVIGLELP